MKKKNTENLCTDIIKKEVDIKWKDDKMNKAWPYRALEASMYALAGLFMCILYIFVFTFKKGLDLPYILKRGDFLYYLRMNKQDNKKDIIKCRD